MKSNAWTIASVAVWVVVYYTIAALGLPFWVFFASLPPIFLACVYASHFYSSRPTLAFEPIPASGYQTRLDSLDYQRPFAHVLGFQKIDEFYLKINPDVVTYVYKHSIEPVYLCAYHLGGEIACDLITSFGDNASLTTSSHLGAGLTPKPDQTFTQIFENRPYQDLFYFHQRGIDFLKQHNLQPHDIPAVSFRDVFMKSLRDFYRRTRNLLWPMMAIYWTLTKHGKRYCKPVEEQYLAKMIKII
jgi:hypothetical protein